MLRHQFGVESLGADIFTAWHLRILTRICNPRVSALALYHNQDCAGAPYSMSVPSLGSQIGTPLPRRLPSPNHSSDSEELSAMNDCVLLRLLMLWLPCMRTPSLVLRLSDALLPSLHRCRRSASLVRPVSTIIMILHSLLWPD